MDGSNATSYHSVLLNLILFHPAEIGQPLAIDDFRARHLLDVLKSREGERFDAGLIDGPRGKGRIDKVDSARLTLSFTWETIESPALDPIVLIIGLPRPQTARKILQAATALGASAIHFVLGEKTEPSYASSSLWKSGEWNRHLIAGAEQSFTTRLPVVTWSTTLQQQIAALPPDASRVALDNYEAALRLSAFQPAGHPLALALGPERGWSSAERILLREKQFTLAHLGSRVLRTETACISAIAVMKAALGLW